MFIYLFIFVVIPCRVFFLTQLSHFITLGHSLISKVCASYFLSYFPLPFYFALWFLFSSLFFTISTSPPQLHYTSSSLASIPSIFSPLSLLPVFHLLHLSTSIAPPPCLPPPPLINYCFSLIYSTSPPLHPVHSSLLSYSSTSPSYFLLLVFQLFHLSTAASPPYLPLPQLIYHISSSLSLSSFTCLP